MNERTTGFVGFKLKDKAGRVDASAPPTSLTYRVDCLTTGQAVRPFTPIAPVSEGEIVLTADDTAILGPTNQSETKRITLVAVYGSQDDRLTAEFDVKVERLKFSA